MKKIFVFLFVFSIVLVFSMQAQAALNLVGQGTSTYGTYNLIYDSDLDITWYDLSNYDPWWYGPGSWAAGLSVTFGSNTYDDWRLPTDASGPCSGYDCTGSEMGHLYYTELGNAAGGPLDNTGDFQNLNSGIYWLGNGSGYLDAWAFDTSNGNQGTYPIDWTLGGLAVRNGLAVAPEPISSTLFVVGGATLGIRRFWKKRKIT